MRSQPCRRFPCWASRRSIARPLKPADVCAQVVQQLAQRYSQCLPCWLQRRVTRVVQLQVAAAASMREPCRREISAGLRLCWSLYVRSLVSGTGPGGCQRSTEDDRVAWGQGAWSVEPKQKIEGKRRIQSISLHTAILHKQSPPRGGRSQRECGEVGAAVVHGRRRREKAHHSTATSRLVSCWCRAATGVKVKGV